MKRLIFSILLLALLPAIASAQRTGSIRAILIDGGDGSPLPGAVVELAPQNDTTAKKYFTSVFGGAIEIPNIAYGNYRLKISFMGYKDYLQNINVNRTSVDLGKIKLDQGSMIISTVVAEGQAMRTSQKGDTLVYNASAFKVAKDADTETLLSKMPGIKVVGGEVEAQGETVKKVFVDGKEFFGQDVNAAIKNLPAEIVSKIEVYNKLSDQAEFTGTDDGEGYKAINIVTTVSSGQFGKAYAGYGFNDKYIAGANVNIFNGDSRVAIMGMANNVNQQNFSMEDILGAIGNERSGMRSGGGGMRAHMSMRSGGNAGNFMVTQQDGISTVQSLGINYSDKWGKKLDFSGNYFFNNSKNENMKETKRQYITVPNIYNAYSNSETRNMEHRFNGRLNYRINENHMLMWRPGISIQNYRTSSYGYGETFDVTDEIPRFIRSDSTNRDNHNWGYNISSSLIYRAKLGKPGRTLSTYIMGSLKDNDRKNFSYSLGKIKDKKDILRKEKRFTDSKSYNISGNVMYTEPISKYVQLNAQYRIRYNYSDSDVKVYPWEKARQDYDPDFDPENSSIYNSGYLTQSAGPGFNYNKNKNVLISNVSYQRSSLSKDQDYPALGAGKKRYSFNNVVYFAMLNKMFNPGTSLRIHARSYTENPSVSQLQEVTNISNPRFVTSGNPNLDPSYSHNVFAHFIRSNTAKGRTFMVMGGFTSTSKYIADSVVTTAGFVLPNGDVLGEGAEYTKPVNMSGNWRITGAISYGLPINPIKSNMNFNVGVSYNEAPSIVDGKRNKQSGQYYNAGAVLGSNISESIDFTINYNGGYNIVRDSYSKPTNTNTNTNTNAKRTEEYFSQTASLQFKWVAWAGFTLSGSLVYSQYRGITEKYNEEYMNCNLFLGKKLFKNQRGEIVFGVNDLFNQKSNYSRNVTDRYIDDIKNNVIGRYFRLQFVYNLRSFGKRPTNGRPGGDSLRHPSGAPMGPPHGVGPGGHGGGF